ncbi:positive regulation of Schwann cell migration [Mactra antiquata]
MCQVQNCVSTECNGNTCDVCIDGYYVQSGSCVQCQQVLPNCVTCRSSSVCDVCNDGYYLQSGNCYKCHERCSLCTSSTQCTKCEDMYWNFLSHCASPCSTNCTYSGCDDTTGYCYDCKPGTYGLLCGQDCNLCRIGQCDLTNCTNGCKDGYYQENTPSGYSYCYKCVYDNCITCSNGTYCTQCVQDYYRSYYRVPVSGRGQINCLKCYESCLDCSSTEHCHEDCIQQCSDPAIPGTTKSNHETTTLSSTTTQPITNGPVTTEPTTDTSTEIPDEPKTDSSVQKADDDSSTIIGAAAGGGAVVVLAIVVILLVCVIKRRSKGNNGDQMETPMQAHMNAESDYPVYAKPNKPTKSNSQQAKDYLYAVPNKPKHTKSEIDEPQRFSYRNVMIDLDIEQAGTAETDVDAVQLEIVDGDGVTTDIDMGENIPSSDTYYNMEGLIRSQVNVTQLFDYVKQKTDYDKEFKKLLKGLQRSCNEALKPQNRLKNRYNGIYAYDATRVILQSGTYINANYIDGHNKAQAYIASLGPTASTMNEYETFWEMVWQHNVETIVMLTILEEGVKMKCEQYWPDRGEVMICGQYILEGVSEKVFADFVVREIALRNADTADKRHVVQYQYTAWPDRSVPDSVVSLVAYRDKVEQQNRNRTSPIVVHCSAGIGRTGTYIALDYLLQQARDDTYVDIFGCAIGLRGQRVNMIQTEQQYEYLHHCVLYVITCSSDPIKEVKLQKGVNDEQISTQYDALNALETIKRGWSLTSTKRTSSQIKKSGYLDDRYRVRLESSRDSDINAVYINSYLRQNQFIITQTPLASNLPDFIRMIYQEKCPVIVCLDDDSTSEKIVGQYIPPDNKLMKIGQYQYKCTRSNVMDEYIARDLKLSHSVSGHQLDIRQYQIRGWNSKDMTPSDLHSFLKLVQEINNNNSKLQQKYPILIHCLTGADRSGLFCGVSTMLETLTVEKQLSIVHVIHHIRERCHTALKTFETFKFCYNCIRYLLNREGDNKLYYNVKTLQR